MSLQVEIGETLSLLTRVKQAILHFLMMMKENYSCGILLDNNYILHTHVKVSVDRIDQTGIYNLETQKHSHKLRIIKKIF